MPEHIPITDDKDKQQELLNSDIPTFADIINSGENQINSAMAKVQKPLAGGTITTFPAKQLGYNQVYSKTAFKRLGFNPYRDNIKHYSENSTNWENFQDAYKAQWKMHNSMFSFFGANMGEDPDSYLGAKNYEKLVEEGSPIGRDDTFSWALKQYVQSGYTAAIVTSIVAEELALAAVTTATRGATAEAAWLGTVRNFNRLVDVADKTNDINKARKIKESMSAIEMEKKAASTLEKLNDLQNAGKARNYWESAKAMAKAAPGYTARTLFPHATGYMNAVKNGDYALNGFAGATQGFGAFWREIREFKLAFDEGGLEQAFVEKDAMAQMIDIYKQNNNGDMPEGESLEELQKVAADKGKSTLLNNVGLIYMTNKVGFGTLFNKFGTKVFNESVRKSNAGTQFLTKADLKKGRLAEAEWVPKGKGIKARIDRFKYFTKKSTLKKAPLRTLKYLGGATAMATTEGFQEYVQEVIQDAEVKRARDKYTKGIEGKWLDDYATSMEKYISPEGGEIFLSGFVMGAFAGPHRAIVGAGSDLAMAGIEYATGEYKTTREHEKKVQERYEKHTEKLNEIFKTPHDMVIGLGGLAQYTAQDNAVAEQNKAVEEGDKKAFLDFKDDNAFRVLERAEKNGTLDLLLDQIDQMSGLSDKELVEAFKDSIGEKATEDDLIAFRDSAQDVVHNAKMIKKLQNHADKVHINPWTLGGSRGEDDTTFGINNAFMYKAFEGAKREIVKAQFSYQKTLEREGGILKEFTANPPMWNKNKVGSGYDLTLLLNNTDLKNEVTTIKKTIESLEFGESEGTLSAQDKEELADARRKLDILSRDEELSEDGTVTRRGGIGPLVRALQQVYEAESAWEAKAEAFEKLVEEGGTITVGLQPGMKATLTSKSGTSNVTILEIGEGKKKGKYKIKKSTGWSGWVKESSIKVDPATTKLTKSEKEELETEKEKEEILTELRAAFDEYMEYIADKNDNTLNKSELDDAFQMFLDFYALKQDGKNLTSALNLLLDPQGFENLLIRKATADQRIWENKKEIIADALETYYKSMQDQELLSTLADPKGKFRAFLLEEDVIRLLDMNSLHDIKTAKAFEFFDIESLKPIDVNSERYQSIYMEIVQYISKKWNKESAVKEEYKVGSNIYAQDIVEDEATNELANEIYEATRGKGEVKITSIEATNEDGTVEVIISLNDKLVPATLRKVAEKEGEEVAEEVEETEAAEVVDDKYAGLDEMTVDTSFEDLIPLLAERVTNAFNSHNEEMDLKSEEEGMSFESAKFSDEQDFMDSAPGKVKLQKFIEEEIANRDATKTTEEITKPAKPAPKKPAAAKADDTYPTGDTLGIPTAEVTLPKEVEQNILEGQTTMVSLGLQAAVTASIVRALQDAGILSKTDEKLVPEAATVGQVKMTVTDSAGDKKELIFIYVGKFGVTDLRGNKYDNISKLGLPTTATAEYKYPITEGETTYYSANENEQKWLMTEEGKRHIFNVYVSTPLEKSDLSGDFAERDKWAAGIEKRLIDAANVDAQELERVKDEIVNEDIDYIATGMTSQNTLINKIYDELVSGALKNVKISKLNVGDTVQISKFGWGIVKKKTDKTVTIQKIGKETTTTLNQAQLSEKLLTLNPTEMLEEVAEELTTPSTPEEVETTEENKDINSEITEGEIKENLKGIKNKSEEDVTSSFFGKAKDDEDACITN